MAEDRKLTTPLGGLFEEAAAELFPPTGPKTWDPLTDRQIELLESNGNRSGDWSRVLTAPGSELYSVEDCRFDGDVRLALVPSGSGKTGHRPLLRDSMLENSEIGPGCRIISVGLLSGYILEEGVTLENCGRLRFVSGTTCGNGADLRLGVETGERTVRSFLLMNTSLAEALSGAACRGEYDELLDGLLARLSTRPRGLIRTDSVLRGTSSVEDCFIGHSCRIENATAVRDTSLLGSAGRGVSVTDGALVRGSILQWGAEVDSMAIVENSVIGECATVERSAKVIDSFLGPDSVIGEGEVTACLAGPFTAAHHQSLLIAARWPEGRGNVAYGANVGSNHTSRMPDQEIRPGEGMFFGLGCSIKFPSDFSMAPYSIVATGVTTLPQRVEMPFSLICEPFSSPEGVPRAFNQIVPAWVLSDNLFALLRNRRKYQVRGRAQRWKDEADVFSPSILGSMRNAIARLSKAAGREYYTGSHVPGLGKNFMTEEHRLKAVESYGFHLTFNALIRLLERAETCGVTDEVLSGPSGDPVWEPARCALREEFPGSTVTDLLGMIDGMWERVISSALMSRAKDFQRGIRVFPDYEAIHGVVEEDPFLAELRSERTGIAGRIAKLSGP